MAMSKSLPGLFLCFPIYQVILVSCKWWWNQKSCICGILISEPEDWEGRYVRLRTGTSLPSPLPIIYVSRSKGPPSVLMLLFCGCHMQQGGVSELAMTRPWTIASSKGCQVATVIFGGNSTLVLLQASSWLCWGRTGFLLLGVLASNTEQVGGGSPGTLSLKLISNTGTGGWGWWSDPQDS